MSQQGEAQAEAKAGPVDPTTITMHFTVQKSNHDESAAYPLSRANQIGMKYQRAVLGLPGDSTNWFSLYELTKKEPTSGHASNYLQARRYEFETMNAAIAFVQDMLRLCGYEVTRRSNFDDAAYLLPAKTAHDMEYMMSLLLAEHDWETSVMAYRNPSLKITPRFHVCSDVPHTPQTKPGKPQRTVEDASSGSEAEEHKRHRVKKKLEFASSEDSGAEARPTELTPSAMPLVDKVKEKLAKMVAKGKLTVTEASTILFAMSNADKTPAVSSARGTSFSPKKEKKKSPKSAAWSESSADEDDSDDPFFGESKKYLGKLKKSTKSPRSRSNRSSFMDSSSDESGYSSSEVTKFKTPKRSRSTKKSPKSRSSRKSNFDIDMDFSSSEDSDERSPRRHRQNHVTTVIQNLNVKPFAGSKTTPEESKYWLSKFLHTADISGWSSRQKRKAMVDAFTGQAKHWERQLPEMTRKSWKRLVRAFHKKYCRETTPATLTHYRLTQKTDESALDYLYRFNVAAIRAHIDFRVDEYDSDSDREPEELQNHIRQFFDTLHDKAVQNQFRFSRYKSIDKLEEKLMVYENSLGKPSAKKTAAKKQTEDSSDPPAVVNKVNGGGDKRNKASGSSGVQYEGSGEAQQYEVNKCEHCGKNGHTKETCFQLQTCPYCKKLGHGLKYCRAFLDRVSDFAVTHPRVATGETTIDELVENMTRSN